MFLLFFYCFHNILVCLLLNSSFIDSYNQRGTLLTSMFVFTFQKPRNRIRLLRLNAVIQVELFAVKESAIELLLRFTKNSIIWIFMYVTLDQI